MTHAEPCCLKAVGGRRLPGLAWVTVCSALLTTPVGAVTPLSVGPSGAGPLTFDTQPFLSNGWSTLNIAGLNTSIQTAAALDAAVNTNAAVNISTQIPPDTTAPAPTFEIGSPFRWNAIGQFIESRPTANAYQLLLLALRNDSGADRPIVALSYDFGALFPSGAIENEDPG